MSAPTVETLLLQAQMLLEDADEANHTGAWQSFALQAQARSVLAEAIDRLEELQGELALSRAQAKVYADSRGHWQAKACDAAARIGYLESALRECVAEIRAGESRAAVQSAERALTSEETA